MLAQEVCERLGFPLCARPLESGRYFVMWPKHGWDQLRDSVSGQRLLLDAYGCGALLPVQEVRTTRRHMLRHGIACCMAGCVRVMVMVRSTPTPSVGCVWWHNSAECRSPPPPPLCCLLRGFRSSRCSE